MASHRQDRLVLISDIDPAIVREFRYRDIDNKPKIESDSAYDLETLRNLSCLRYDYRDLSQHQNAGQVIGSVPGVKLTPDGAERLREWERPWWKTAIDKQPMTFVNILIALFSAAMAALAAWFASGQG